MPLGFHMLCIMHDASCCRWFGFPFPTLILVNSSNPFGQTSAAQIPMERLCTDIVIANEWVIFKYCGGGARKA